MNGFRTLYRLALALLPREFRARHGAEALRMADRRVREEAGLRRAARATRELVDLLRAAPRIRREHAPAERGEFVDMPARRRRTRPVTDQTLALRLRQHGIERAGAGIDPPVGSLADSLHQFVRMARLFGER